MNQPNSAHPSSMQPGMNQPNSAHPSRQGQNIPQVPSNSSASNLLLPGLSPNVNVLSAMPSPGSQGVQQQDMDLSGDQKRPMDHQDMSHASVQVLARLISDQVNRISAMNKVSDEILKMQEIENKDICDWPHNELVHWIITFRNKKFSKYVGNVIANSLDGQDMVHLSKSAMTAICDGNSIHGELLYKFIKERTKLDTFDNLTRKRKSDGSDLEKGKDILQSPLVGLRPGLALGQGVQFAPNLLAMRDGAWVKRKRRCKVAILTRDLITYIDSFERIMKKGRLSMNAAAEQHDAPISRGSYRNYLKIRQQLAELGYDLTDNVILDTPFKDLLKRAANGGHNPGHNVANIHGNVNVHNSVSVNSVPPVPSVPVVHQ